MAELSKRSRVPIPTIHYYLREGLLEPGRRTSPNQAEYDERHVRRLALIRALIDVGGMSVASVAALFGHLQSKHADELNALGLVQYSLVREGASRDTVGPDAAADADQFIQGLGWHVRSDHPARAALASVMERLRQLEQADVAALIDQYADAAHKLASAEVEVALARTGLDQRAEAVVMLGVFGDALLATLRRLAQEDVIWRALGPDGSNGRA